MELRSFSLVPDHVVLQDLRASVSTSNLATARLIEVLAVVDERRLYAEQGYDSMLSFCIGDLHFSEDSARKRILVARTAQRCPAVLAAIAEGRLHLSAVVMLAPHLTRENAPRLIEEATYRTKDEIATLLARHFPRPDLTACVEVAPSTSVLSPDPKERVPELVHGMVKPHVPAGVEPRSQGRFAVQFMLGDSELAELRHAQELAARLVDSQDLAAFYAWAVREVIRAQEKRQFAAASRPRAAKAPTDGRRIPAQVKREVRERDQRRCTFVSDSGRRCAAKRFLDFDHIQPVADGGKSTSDNVRLLCRAHNQLEAERRFGKGFMQRKRQEARASAAPSEHAPGHTAIQAQRAEIVPYLRQLGFKEQQARHGAGLCDHLLGQPLDALVKHALKQLTRARFERCTIRPDAA